MSYPAESVAGTFLEFGGSLSSTGTDYAYVGSWVASDGARRLSVICQINNPATVVIEEGVALSGATGPTEVRWNELPATSGHAGPGGSTYNSTSGTVDITARFFRLVIVGANPGNFLVAVRSITSEEV